MSYLYVLLVSATVLWLVYRYLQHRRAADKAEALSDDGKNAAEQEDPLAAYDAIEPLKDFDWKTTPPLRLRPFKPKYHLTMGECHSRLTVPVQISDNSSNYKALETAPLSDLLQMDNTYLSRIKLRRQLMDSHPEATLACNAVAEPAALELYDWLIGTYLRKRFPTCFSLVNHQASPDKDNEQDPSDANASLSPTHLLNHITSEHIPLHSTHPLTALRTLSSNIDTDFLILLPEHSKSNPQSDSEQPTYTLQSFATAFPSGFSTLSKLSLPLTAIHAPVPSYIPKLSKSMDRFFARLPAGKLARRANWTITTSPALFSQSGTHMSSSSSSSSSSPLTAEETAASIAAQKQGLEVAEMRLRCELQTLHRLPGSGALVFAFKTYSYTLEEVKAEGSGEALAEATEGFVRGSVPEMSVYKREAVWGESVREFLRG
jgi:hypothetical protein